MTDKDLGYFLSNVLRHNPEAAGISIDYHGAWTDIDKLIEGSARKGKIFDRSQLERVVLNNNKQRYGISADGKRIRARQGHSIPVDLELEPAVPPTKLYHGTAHKNLKDVASTGIRKMGRQLVHLSKDRDTAINVGSRHGSPFVIEVDTARMHADGVTFYLSDNGVWLTDYVDPCYFCNLSAKGTPA